MKHPKRHSLFNQFPWAPPAVGVVLVALEALEVTPIFSAFVAAPQDVVPQLNVSRHHAAPLLEKLELIAVVGCSY